MENFTIPLLVVLLLTLAGCGEKATGNKTEAAAPSAAAKSDTRAAMIKSLEARAAQSDADAQLSLAKTLLDGSVTPPDYERAKGLLVGASEKGLPEATLGLYLLRAQKAINDDRLSKAKTLREQALATGDTFITVFLFDPAWMFLTNSFDLPEQPEQVLKLADSGYPLANAKMAIYYGVIASTVASCRERKVLKMKQSKSDLDECLRASRIPDSFQHAITYASKLLDAKEVDVDKMRYWSLLRKRIAASKKIVSNSSPLSQMQIDLVLRKADPYFSVIAEALSSAGMILKDGNGVLSNPTQAAQLLRRAAELGAADAQNALGELYQSGRGVPKDCGRRSERA